MSGTQKFILSLLGIAVVTVFGCIGAFVVFNAMNMPVYDTQQYTEAEIQPSGSVNDLEDTATTNICPANIAKGATVFVPANCTVFGDVTYGEVVLHDIGGSDQATFVNVVGSGAYITAPYGAGVEPTLSFQNYTGMVNHYVVDEMQTGCGDSNPCSEVRAVIIEYGNIVLDTVH